MNTKFDIGPDIEVEADQWEQERQDMNSCEALQIMDGVPIVLQYDD